MTTERLMGCHNCGQVNVVDFDAPSGPRTVAVEYPSASVARFVAERCVAGDRSMRIPAPAARAAYEDWCAQAGVDPLSPQAFGRAIVNLMGVERIRSNGQRYYAGIILRSE